MPKAKTKLLAAAIPLLIAAGCIFDAPVTRVNGPSNVTSVMLDTVLPASATPDRVVELYEPFLDTRIGDGVVGVVQKMAPVNVRDHGTGQVVQYRLTKQTFGTWSTELEFKWNYFKLAANFFFPSDLPDTAGLASQTGEFYKRVHAADSFTNYFDSTRATEIWNKIESSAKPGAIGIEVHLNATEDTVLIRRVVANSPGARAGLKPGMVVLAVDDSAITGDSAIERFTRFATGDSGKKTTFTMLGPNGVFKAPMVREPVAFPTVLVDTLSDVGYINITGFTLETVDGKNTHLEFRDALRLTRNFPVTVIDLRDNHGGVLNLALKMCDEVIPEGHIIINEEQRLFSDDKRAPILSVNTYRTTKGGLGENRKYVLLSNHWSASAAEIFLIALKENLGTPQMGERSYGKGVGQFPVNTPGKGLALVTFLHFRSSQDLDYHKKGLEPDYPDSTSPDSVLAHAVALAQAPGAKKLSAAAAVRTMRRARVIEWNRREAARRSDVDF